MTFALESRKRHKTRSYLKVQVQKLMPFTINDRGFVRVGKKRHNNPMPYSISYLSTEDVKRVDSGELKIIGERKDGILLKDNRGDSFQLNSYYGKDLQGFASPRTDDAEKQKLHSLSYASQ